MKILPSEQISKPHFPLQLHGYALSKAGQAYISTIRRFPSRLKLLACHNYDAINLLPTSPASWSMMSQQHSFEVVQLIWSSPTLMTLISLHWWSKSNDTDSFMKLNAVTEVILKRRTDEAFFVISWLGNVGSCWQAQRKGSWSSRSVSGPHVSLDHRLMKLCTYHYGRLKGSLLSYAALKIPYCSTASFARFFLSKDNIPLTVSVDHAVARVYDSWDAQFKRSRLCSRLSPWARMAVSSALFRRRYSSSSSWSPPWANRRAWADCALSTSISIVWIDYGLVEEVRVSGISTTTTASSMATSPSGLRAGGGLLVARDRVTLSDTGPVILSRKGERSICRPELKPKFWVWLEERASKGRWMARPGDDLIHTIPIFRKQLERRYNLC